MNHCVVYDKYINILQLKEKDTQEKKEIVTNCGKCDEGKEHTSQGTHGWGVLIQSGTRDFPEEATAKQSSTERVNRVADFKTSNKAKDFLLLKTGVPFFLCGGEIWKKS